MPEAELSSDCRDSELALPLPGCVVRGKSPDLLSLGFLICKMGIMRGPTSLGGREGDQAEPSATPGQWGWLSRHWQAPVAPGLPVQLPSALQGWDWWPAGKGEPADLVWASHTKLQSP